MALFFFAAIIAAVYSNTLDAPWHLDDFSNVSENPSIRINSLDSESLLKFFRQSIEKGRLNRPLSFLTFALNWYFGKDSPQGYHVVNIVIHILTTFLLFLSARLLFKTPNLQNLPQRDVDFICLLGAVLWAVNPIQTQAITYIVQRMASMAAMFYIASVYCYLAARFSQNRVKQTGLFALCIFCFFMAMASKENAILLPMALFVLELVFFQDVRNPKTLRAFLGAALVGVGLVIVVGAFLFSHGNLGGLLEYGNTRSFSASERLMTQPRVILLYLSQIFYPVPTRLSIEHDIVVSTSLLHPWTTVLGVGVVCGLVAFAILLIRWQPLLSFALLFFFINHLIESSVIGLELVFEHRNYLPSMFLFFPVAWGLKKLLNHYRESSRFMAGTIAAFCTLIVVGFGVGTYVRNQAWGSAKSLWEDAAAKAPLSGRPLHNLAWGHYEAIGDYRTALRLYSKALGLAWNNNFQEPVLLNNIASLHYMVGDYASAAAYWRKAIEKRQDYVPASCRLALALLRSGQDREARGVIERLLQDHPSYSRAINLNGILMLRQGRFSDALPFFKKAIKSPATAHAATLNMGAAHLFSGETARAEWYFKNAFFRFPSEKISLLWLAVLESQSVDGVGERPWMNRLLSAVKIADILVWMPEDGAIGIYRDSIALPARTQAFSAALASEVHRISGFPSKYSLRLLVAEE